MIWDVRQQYIDALSTGVEIEDDDEDGDNDEQESDD
jgi:hypothetical protein